MAARVERAAVRGSVNCGVTLARYPVARPGPHGDFTVVPLITDQRYYGEVPVQLRWGWRDGRV